MLFLETKKEEEEQEACVEASKLSVNAVHLSFFVFFFFFFSFTPKCTISNVILTRATSMNITSRTTQTMEDSTCDKIVSQSDRLFVVESICFGRERGKTGPVPSR